MIWAALLLGSVATTCPVERAHYVLRGSDAVTAEFRPAPTSRDWPAGVALVLRFAASKRSWYALPWNGGTDRRQHLRLVRATGDGLPADVGSAPGDLDLMTTDADYRFATAVPRRGEVAPAHLLLPGAGGRLWHATTNPVRDELPDAFFDLAGCAATLPPVAPVMLPKVP
jgi:hypothetical protein